MLHDESYTNTAQGYSPPDRLVNSPTFRLLSRRDRGRFLGWLWRLRTSLDPTNPLDTALIDALDVEVDRLHHVLRGAS